MSGIRSELHPHDGETVENAAAMPNVNLRQTTEPKPPPHIRPWRTRITAPQEQKNAGGLGEAHDPHVHMIVPSGRSTGAAEQSSRR